MLGDRRGTQKRTYIEDYVVFDLETTGTSPRNDAIIEISAVKARSGQVVDTFSKLVNPERPIPYYATAVNNITDEMVAQEPTIEIVLPEFVDFIEDDILVGHNIHCFDMKFIWKEAENYFGKTITNDYIDTLPMARRCLPQLAHHRLVDLANHYGIGTEGAHRALADCLMNQKCYEKLHLEELNKCETGIQKQCPKCGGIMKRRSGRYGEFWGCSEYPVCRYTENI